MHPHRYIQGLTQAPARLMMTQCSCFEAAGIDLESARRGSSRINGVSEIEATVRERRARSTQGLQDH